MSNSRGTPTLGSRATHDVATDPTLHASDIEAGAPTVHNPTPGADGTYPISDGTQWEAAYPRIPLLTEDPASPVDGQVWVRKTVSATGTPVGLLLLLTTTLYTRELSIFDGGGVYRTTLTVGA
jgi:hypothetical protein